MRVMRVGVCGTDLHAYLGEQPLMTYPVVLGHELAVEVLGLGPECEASGVTVGDRCTVVPYLHDGTCDACSRGKTNCCETLEVLGVHRDGGMTEALVLPADALVPANDVETDSLCLVEMLSIGAHAVARAGLTAGDRVLVIGGGPIGLSVLAFARDCAAELAVAEVSASRLTFLRESGLADAVVDVTRPSRGDASASGADDDALESVVRAAFAGRLPTVVIDATGNAASMQRALGLVTAAGTLVLVGHTRGTLTFDNPTLHTREASILASRNATRTDFGHVLEAVRSGRVDPASWITHRVVPEALPDVMPLWASGGNDVVKAVVEFVP